MLDPTPTSEGAVKPALRGVLHQWAAVFAAGAGTSLVALAPNARAALAAGIYAASLTLLLGTSAVYHRFNWAPGPRMWLRRADHASIFLLIGGSYTPIASLALGGETGEGLLLAIWCGVAVGVVKSMFWPSAPKWVTAAVAIAVGWTLVPYREAILATFDSLQIALILGGGVAYTLGAVAYALKRPNPWPTRFGYHEIFHALTLVGAGMHLAMILRIVRAQA